MYIFAFFTSGCCQPFYYMIGLSNIAVLSLVSNERHVFKTADGRYFLSSQKRKHLKEGGILKQLPQNGSRNAMKNSHQCTHYLMKFEPN